MELPIRHNATISCLSRYTGPCGWIYKNNETKDVTELTGKMNLKCSSIEAPVKSLSGGNQQKVSLSKLIASQCDVLIFDEPTRGVDVGAKREIYALINSLAEQGYTIIMVSSEMAEIVGMCDRALVFRNGTIAGELNGSEITEQNIIKYAMGVGENATCN